MGQLALARSAKAHAVRAAALSWLTLSVIVAAILIVPLGWFAPLVPIEGVMTIPVGMVIAAVVLILLPVELLGDAIVAELRADDASGRLRNIADELSIALGEPAGRVVVHTADTPNVGAFPTRGGVVVMATTQAVAQLQRDELEALVAAQFAGMRDPWCRLATRAELVWKLTIWLAFGSVVLALPIAWVLGGGLVFAPRVIEASRDLCADAAGVSTTRHPTALANAFRHLVPSASAGRQQRFVKRWYLPISPFLVLPKRLQSTTSVGTESGPERRWTDTDEVTMELHLRADRAEALASGADPREYTGREFLRRWRQLGSDSTASERPSAEE